MLLAASSLQRWILGQYLGLLPLLSAAQIQRLFDGRAIQGLHQQRYGANQAIITSGRVPIGSQHQLQSINPAASSCHVTMAAWRHSAGLEAIGTRSSRSWDGDWMSWLGFAAAAFVAASSAVVAADAPADDKARQAALSSAELAVSEAYQEVLQDWSRTAAQQQQQQSGSTNSNTPPAGAPQPQQPQVQLDGHFLTVTVPLVQGVDVRHLLRLIDQGLDQLALQGSSSSSQQQQTRLLGTSKVVQWDISRTLKTPPNIKQHKGSHGASSSKSSSREQLKVQVVLPLQPGSSPHQSSSSSSSSSGAKETDKLCDATDSRASNYGYVSVVKPSGAFTSDELALLARLVAAANKQHPGGSSNTSCYTEDSWLGPFGLPGSSSSSIGELGSPEGHPGPGVGGFGGIADNLLNKVFGSLVNDIFDELDIDINNGQHWQQQLQQHIQHMEHQLKDSLPPEVITWLQDFQRQQQQQQEQGEQLPLENPADDSAAGLDSSLNVPKQQQQQQPLPWQTPAARSAAQQLQQLGAQVYFPAVTSLSQQHHQQQQQQDGSESQSEEGWGALAGYEEQKQALEDFLLLPLRHPEVFDRVAARTRKLKSSGGSRPRAVLFEGPPGTGKTSSARLLSRRAALPLVYVPLEALVSKWYGESEQNLAKLFKACKVLGGCIIFLDELDSLATSRDRSDMHEASRRLLGVLLREIDGFDNTLGSGNSSSSSTGVGSKSGSSSSSSSNMPNVLIGATNRRQDLDTALLSRFDLSIHFGLPDEQCRAAILHQYANHLESQELSRIAEKTSGFSGRDLRDVCEQTERQWASKIIRGEVDAEQLPGIDDYLANVRQRKEGAGARGRGGDYPWINGGLGQSGQYRT